MYLYRLLVVVNNFHQLKTRKCAIKRPPPHHTNTTPFRRIKLADHRPPSKILEESPELKLGIVSSVRNSFLITSQAVTTSFSSFFFSFFLSPLHRSSPLLVHTVRFLAENESRGPWPVESSFLFAFELNKAGILISKWNKFLCAYRWIMYANRC